MTVRSIRIVIVILFQGTIRVIADTECVLLRLRVQCHSLMQQSHFTSMTAASPFWHLLLLFTHEIQSDSRLGINAC